jgi:hypothetical protein
LIIDVLERKTLLSLIVIFHNFNPHIFMKKQSFKLFSFILLAIVFSSCNLEIEPVDGDTVINNEPEFGVISGVVVSPTGKAIGNATVEVVENEKYNSKTDTEGRFSFEAPAGEQELRIFTGSGDVFSTSYF